METKTLVTYFDAFASRQTRPALFYKNGYRTQRITYVELDGRMRKIAASFDRKGLKKGDRVVLWGANSPDWVAVFFACILRGLVAVPLDVRGAADFTQKIFHYTEAALLVCDAVKTAEIPGVPCLDFETLFREAETLEAGRPDFRQAAPSDPAEILFTSGTTAEPKGVVLTHENIVSNVDALWGLSRDWKNEKLLSLLPLSHIFEQTAGLWLPLSQGHSVTYLKILNAASIFSCLEDDRVTLAAVVPRLLSLLKSGILREVERQKKEKIFSALLHASARLPGGWRRKLFPALAKKFGRLKYFFVGGASLEPAVESFWENLGIPVIQGYGLTETSPVISANRMGDRRFGSIGKVLAGVTVKLGPENEIWVRGKNVFSGYYRNDEKTREVFEDGWFKTGDLGEFDGDGFLYFRGRKKDVIVTAEGLNVYPDDLEAVLRTVPAVKDCCVVGIPRDERVEVHAALILRDPSASSKDAVDRANARLADYQKIQSHSIWPDEDFPRTVTMKVKKNEVLKGLSGAKPAGEEAEAPQTTADRLYHILAKLAKLPRGSVRPESRLGDDLGLSSLDRVELTAVIEEEFRITIPETLLGSAVCVSAIEDFLRERPSVPEPVIPKWPLSGWARALRGPLQALFFFPLVRTFCRMHVEGRENLEGLTEPVIFIANHVSYFDGPVFLMGLPRPLRRKIAPAVWRGFFEEPPESPFWLRWWKRFTFGPASLGFNIYLFDSHHGVKKSLEHTGWLMDRGFHVLLFPEGIRSATGAMDAFRPGIGMMAATLDAPVVPAGITGLYRIFPPGKVLPRRGDVTVRFGKPVRYSGGSREEFVERLRREVAGLVR